MRLAVGDVDEAGNGATQVEQRVQLDGCLGTAKRSPRINRQTQVDGGGVERVNGRVQIDAQWLVDVQRTCHTNQVLRKFGVDLPRSSGIRVGQRIARNRLATKAHVIQPLGLGTQVDLDIAQRLAIRQLGEGHREELVQTTEVLHFVFAPMGGHATAKCAQRQIRHELRKHERALVHGGPSRNNAKDRKSDARRSNRDQTQAPELASKSLTYDVLM